MTEQTETSGEADNTDHSNTLGDVKQYGIFAALGSLSYVFWICGGMEMVERLAYYGVRSLSSLYATDAVSNGGLGLTGADLGIIFMVWALVQTFVPVFTGGLSDRFGYKESIFLSTIIKIAGYLIMATNPTFMGFTVGAMVLAFGTGIFKPGLQGTIVRSSTRKNSSMAWGVFYQTVNIGGFMGPIIAGSLRQLDWANVFYVCSMIISLNFLLLMTYRDPGFEDEPGSESDSQLSLMKKVSAAMMVLLALATLALMMAPAGPMMTALRAWVGTNMWAFSLLVCAGNMGLLLAFWGRSFLAHLRHTFRNWGAKSDEKSLFIASLHEVTKPIIMIYIILFSGFWFMLNAFWDVLPLYIRDWVDTSVIVTDLFGPEGPQSSVISTLMVLNPEGTAMQPEGLVNLNAALIMLVCFIVAGLSAKLRATSSMALGTFLASAALIAFGSFNWVWAVVIAILIFSMGEMLSSPKSSEYLGNIAPSDKKAMYLGFTQAPIGIGWIAEGYFGPAWFENWASKDRLSRVMLEERGMGAEEVAAIPNGEVFQHMVSYTGESAEILTSALVASNNIGQLWYIFGIVGLISAFGMILYGRWTYRLAMAEA